MTISMRLNLQISNPFLAILRSGLQQELAEVERRWARRLESRVEVYPSERPGQSYVRTFVFRDNWAIIGPHTVGGDLVTTLQNNTPYGPRVVGDDLGNMQNQTYHAGRWYLFRREVEASEAQFVREAQAVMNRVLAPVIITP